MGEGGCCWHARSRDVSLSLSHACKLDEQGDGNRLRSSLIKFFLLLRLMGLGTIVGVRIVGSLVMGNVEYILWTPHISTCFVCAFASCNLPVRFVDDGHQQWSLFSSIRVHRRCIFSRLAQFRQLLFPSVFCCSFPLHKSLRRVDFEERGSPIASAIRDRHFS
jgi:hypothetical protein